MSVASRLKELIKTNIPKTIWFNFKMLPLKQAIRLPVFFYGKVQFRNTDGNFIINGNNI